MSKTDVTKSPTDPVIDAPGAVGQVIVKPTAGAGASATPPFADDLEGRDSKKKKKKKYSRGLKQVQRTALSIAKANRRVARAVAGGFAQYYARSDESGRKKRDGAIRDAVKNWAKGLSKAIRKSSGAPNDLASAFRTKRARRQIKRVARAWTPFYLR